MNRREYVVSMLKANTKVYIDTASLMNVEALEQFIQNFEDIFEDMNRRIEVPYSVRLELSRHMRSRDVVKYTRALEALSLIGSHTGMFSIPETPTDEEEIRKAFADMDLLAMLTKNKKDEAQLLITNDRDLADDASKLNNLGSCRGRKVSVCFITSAGELYMNNGSKSSLSRQPKPEEEDLAVKPSEATPTDVPTEEDGSQTENSKNDAEWIRWIAISGGSFTAGVLVHKYGRQAARSTLRLICLINEIISR